MRAGWIVFATGMLHVSVQAAQPTYYLELTGKDREYVDIIVDTTGMSSSIKIQRAPFTVRLRDAANKAVATQRYSMIDGKLPAMVSDLVYQRKYRHGISGARTAEVAGPLTWAVSALGDKSDAVRRKPDKTIVVDEAPAQPVSEGQGQHIGPPPSPVTIASCRRYATIAVQQQQSNIARKCGQTGGRWSTDSQYHYSYCVDAPVLEVRGETEARQRLLARCGG